MIALLLVATIASAQETGGSFGGGDWGDHGSHGGGSYGGGSYEGGSYERGRAPSGGGPGTLEWMERERERREREERERRERERETFEPRSDDVPRSSGGRRTSISSRSCFLCFAPLLVGGLILWVLVQSRRHTRALRDDETTFAGSGPIPRAQSPLWNGVDLTQLRLVIDWRARRFVQSELARMATSGRTATKEGRAELLHATVRLLRSAELAWLYAGEMSFRPMSPPQAQGVFMRLAQSARAKFTTEVVRAEGATVRTAEPGALRAKEHEGQGVVLITLIVAARREIHDVRPHDAADVERLLESLERIGASELVAFEVVWTPAAEDDRMSTAELESIHPDVVRIGGIGGRVFCGHCGGPYAIEIARCPHCGAPNDAMVKST
ncbi:Putative glycine rich membrane protein [Sandaracinus amylolyticus]|uniref:Putative glycine rich membrane protein n=1 Tax=Sandaracinus amylolyticus TaxID=927083 RepID=A0A0F6VZA5_9BACT|nr:Putative glycine rich membrane protein [Sandaracinus amylolyticus]